jgi:tRNA dimethylallyltransferase
MATVDPLIVITGPTASGKSALALELAERYNGEIICADSRTVYKGMDIGTAKPSLEDQSRVPHHLLDVVMPDQRFTAADFQRLAREAIADIRARGKIPFVVGGTGLYIDGLILDYEFGSDVESGLRQEREKMSSEELGMELKKQQIEVPHNHDNKRHLIRALEQGTINRNRLKNPQNGVFVVAIATEKAQLYDRISRRVDEIFSGGVVNETKALMAEYGQQLESMSGNIYPIVRQLIEGSLTLEKAKELSIIKDRQLAKRQITWLKRHDFVKWLSIDEARIYISELLVGSRGRQAEL